MAKTGLHKRGNCECSSDGSYQDERCAWFEEGHEEGMRLATARIEALEKKVKKFRRSMSEGSLTQQRRIAELEAELAGAHLKEEK